MPSCRPISGQACGLSSYIFDCMHAVWIRAAMRHDELLKAGDVDGCVVWKRILMAIDELQLVEPPRGAKVH